MGSARPVHCCVCVAIVCVVNVCMCACVFVCVCIVCLDVCARESLLGSYMTELYRLHSGHMLECSTSLTLCVYVCVQDQRTPLHLAAMDNNTALMAALIEGKAQVDAKDKVRANRVDARRY